MEDLRFPAITERALFQRLKRRLEKHYGQLLRKSREGRVMIDLGEYYAIDIYRNVIVRTHIDLEQLAKDEKVMHPLEKLIKETA
jgi:hypothetical protein